MSHRRLPAGRLLGAISCALLLGGCLDASDDAPGTRVINTTPVADAGPDQVDVPATTRVSLDASGSFDADGDELLYTWEFVSRPAGSAAVLDNPANQNGFPEPLPPATSFVPDIPGTYVLRLTVDDTFGTGTGTDTMSVVAVTPSTDPPVANAGADQALSYAPPALTVALDGTGTSDPDNDPLTYAWVITAFVPSGLPPATSVTLVNPDTATPSFDVTDVDQLGEYTLRLTVSDGTLQSTDDVVITVTKSLPAASVLFGSGALAGAALVWTAHRRRRKAGGAGGE